MPSEPKLFAVFGPDGKVVVDNQSHRGGVAAKKWVAWFYAGMGLSREQRRAKRAGYTGVEVEIVRKGERK